jgi:sortase (surface protein transpeptidase)
MKTYDRRPAHEIDPSDCDELDEIDGDDQFALVWCHTHQKYEWHWVLRAHLLNHGSSY